jgi:hypothetical protein
MLRAASCARGRGPGSGPLEDTRTHRGELMGIPPTGREVDLTASEIFRLADDRIVEQWVAVDNLSLLRQLGVFPPAESGG